MQNCKVDIVIPLSCESCSSNLELRMALRSIERYAGNHGNIYIVSDQPPNWLQNTVILPVSDKHKHNKDANIIDKILAAARLESLTGKFIFWSDDQLALKPFNTCDMLPAYNNRSREKFRGENVWHRRMRRTFDFLSAHGRYPAWNWDSHLPQIMDKEHFKNIMENIDYAAEPGYCVNTLYFGWLNTPPQLPQQAVKATVEQELFLPELPQRKIFLGYNDAACRGNLPRLLKKHFSVRSKFESNDIK